MYLRKPRADTVPTHKENGHTMITSYPSHYATQRAVWSHTTANATFTAAVTKQHETGDYGKQGWAWELSYGPHGGVGFRYTGARREEYIWTHDTDSREVLHTLASFVSAWAESIEHQERTGGQSENADLFPASCIPFLEEHEQFYLDTMPEEDNQPNTDRNPR